MDEIIIRLSYISMMQRLIKKTFKMPIWIFFIGILNGLLPCGLVYLALTSSVITGSSLNGALFMGLFGLGTFPAMMATIILGNYFNQQMRLKINKALPVLLFVMATLLVLRGLELGIPYVSPAYAGNGAVTCH